MRLLNRRAAPAVASDEGWQPTGDVKEGNVIGGRTVGDVNCVSNEAWGVPFTLASAPGASLTIWVYVADGPEDSPADCYQIAYCCRYALTCRFGRTLWDTVAYYYDPELYDDYDRCEADARDHAHTFASTRRDGPSDPDELPFFDWDGVPL